MKSKPFLLMAMVILGMSFLHGVSAVGIGDYTGGLNYLIDFQSGFKKTFSYFLAPNAPTAMDYEATAEGDLAQYFTFSDNLFKDVLPGQIRRFSATLNLPEEKPSPGLHENHICVAEAQNRGGGGVTVRTKACSIIIIRVLYKEKYLQIEDFSVPNVDVGDILNANIVIKSWTEKDIASVKAVIEMYAAAAKDLKKIAELQTEEKPLASNEKSVLHASIDTKGFEPGGYKAVATVYYDENTANASTNFNVGILAVKIVNYTKEVLRNKINKFGVEVESRWNSPIENVYADITIENDTLTTPAIKLQPWETAALTAYWDTANKKAKYYDGRITLYFAGNSTEQNIRVKVLVNPEDIKRLLTYVAVTALSALLVILIVIIALRKPKKGKGRTKK